MQVAEYARRRFTRAPDMSVFRASCDAGVTSDLGVISPRRFQWLVVEVS